MIRTEYPADAVLGLADLNHLELRCRDVPAALAFYETYFDFAVTPGLGLAHESVTVLRNARGFELGLRSDGAGDEFPAWFHTGFRLATEEAVHRLRRRMKDEGVVLDGELKTRGNYSTFVCHDPSGYHVEVYNEPGVFQGAELGSDLNHIHLNVGDRQASAAFYRDIFGFVFDFELPAGAPRIATFLKNAHGFQLALENHPDTRPVPAWFHLGFRLPSRHAVKAAYDELQSRVSVEAALSEISTFAKFLMHDPDGYRIQVYCEVPATHN